MRVVFWDRSLVRPMNSIAESALTFEVTRYTHSVIGGPKAAEVRARGAEDALGELCDWLRCGMEIYDDRGDLVWWGYIDEVILTIGALEIGVRLSELANKIAVAYAYVPPGVDVAGERRTTAWVTDTASIKQFGIKELMLPLARATDAQAAATRDTALGQLKEAIVTPPLSGGMMGGMMLNAAPEARIVGRGWWQTLDWRYATVPTRLALSYDTIGTYAVSFGHADDIEAYAQSFEVSAGFYVQQIEVYLGAVGSPSDNVRVAIWTNPNADGLTPGEELASQNKSGSAVGAFAWQRFTLDAPLLLSGGGRYFLLVERSGSEDPANYYQLQLDESQGYGAGIMRIRVGGGWGGGPAADMPFRLFANDMVNTAVQIQSLATNFGQFLRQVSVYDAGIVQESYRDGDATALYEIEEMMRAGSENGRRLLARVDSARRVQVFEEPPAPTAPYQLMRNGDVRDPNGSLVWKQGCPVGMWVRLGDVFASVGARKLADPGWFFVDESEYNVQQNALTLRPRSASDVWDGGVRNG